MYIEREREREQTTKNKTYILQFYVYTEQGRLGDRAAGRRARCPHAMTQFPPACVPACVPACWACLLGLPAGPASFACLLGLAGLPASPGRLASRRGPAQVSSVENRSPSLASSPGQQPGLCSWGREEAT